MQKTLICLVGSPGAGKSKVIEILQETKGYKSYSVSNMVRAYVASLGIENASREQLQDNANALRKDKGNGIFAQMLADEIENSSEEVIIIDGVRHPDEINIFRNLGDRTIVVGITASPEVRFQRIQERKRPNDPQTWEEFLKADEKDNGVEGKDHQQENAKCLAMADHTIENDGTLDELRTQLEAILHEIVDFKLIPVK